MVAITTEEKDSCNDDCDVKKEVVNPCIFQVPPGASQKKDACSDFSHALMLVNSKMISTYFHKANWQKLF